MKSNYTDLLIVLTIVFLAVWALHDCLDGVVPLVLHSRLALLAGDIVSFHLCGVLVDRCLNVLQQCT